MPRHQRSRDPDEEAAAGVLASTDSTTKLMELGDPEPIGVEDHHDGGVRDVDTDLDHGGGDEHVEVAGPEVIHDRRLLRRRDPTMEQPESQVRQFGCLERSEGVLGGPNVERLGFVDQRAHDIDLPAGANLGANDTPDPILGGVITGPLGDDRCPARWEFIEHRHVKIAVDRHRRSSRDRRGGHDQDIGSGDGVTLLSQRSPLLDTETVLLVDDDDPESGVFDLSWIKACVPMMMSTLPVTRSARILRRSPAATRFVSNSTRSGRSPMSVLESGTDRSPSMAVTPA